MSQALKMKKILRAVILLLGLFSFLVGASCDSSSRQEPEPERTAAKDVRQSQGIIVAMGDSLTAGLGLVTAESYPAQLEQMLADRGLDYLVVNAGISGETSSGARARVDWILKLKPQIVILETGANDGLRGIDPALIEENIDHIIARLKQENVTVVLAGMQMVTNLGEAYVSAFNLLYPRLAAKHQVIFMPFFLQGVAAEASLNQADGIHPNTMGYRIISTNLLPFVEQAIRKRTP